MSNRKVLSQKAGRGHYTRARALGGVRVSALASPLRIIAKLNKPNRSYHIFRLGDEVVNWYLAKFNPIAEPYSSTDDIWLRYREKEDVERWAIFVKGLLPKVVHLLSPRAS